MRASGGRVRSASSTKRSRLNPSRAGTVLVLVALTSVVIGSGPATSVEPAPPAESAPPAGPRSLDDRFAEVAARVPVFGGVFVDDTTDTLVVLTTSGSVRDAHSARDRMLEVFGKQLGNDLATFRVQTLKARYSFAQLMEWRKQADELFKDPGVVSLSIRDRSNRLRIGVDNAQSRAMVEDWRASHGIPSDAVEVVNGSRIRPRATLRDRIRPIMGGIQIHNASSNFPCTLTVNVKTLGWGQAILTAGHCTAVPGIDSGIFYQNTRTSSNRIAFEVKEAPVFYTPPCPPNNSCKWADVLAAQLAIGANVTYKQGTIPVVSHFGDIVWNGVDRFIIRSESVAVEGTDVAIMGQTSGHIIGEVLENCETAQSTDLRLYLCSARVDVWASDGDSGAPVFRAEYGSTLWYHVAFKGVLFATDDTPGVLDSIYSGIINIQNALGGDVDTCYPTYSC